MHGNQLGIGLFGLQFELLHIFGEPGNIAAKLLHVATDLPQLLRQLAYMVPGRFGGMTLGACLKLSLLVVTIGQVEQ